MDLINNQIRLTDLALKLGVNSATIRQHLYKRNGGLSATKFGGRVTGDYLLSIDSVFGFLLWLKGKGRKVNLETIEAVENDIRDSVRNG